MTRERLWFILSLVWLATLIVVTIALFYLQPDLD
jgi:hypothetical protein